VILRIKAKSDQIDFFFENAKKLHNIIKISLNFLFNPLVIMNSYENQEQTSLSFSHSFLESYLNLEEDSFGSSQLIKKII